LVFNHISVKRIMKEDFIAWLWHFRLYGGPFTLTDSRPFSVDSPGIPNTDAGPDFLGARIRIGDTLWVGHVEIHLRSTDWILHGHHKDPQYDAVILHVVFRHDREILMRDQTTLAVLELKDRIDSSLYTRYLQFMASPAPVPCADLLRVSGPSPMPAQWIVSLGMQRMIRRAAELPYLLERVENDWLALLWITFARSFGHKVNDDIFEMLALRTPLPLIRKYSSEPFSLEALLLGQAGLLEETGEEPPDAYRTKLTEVWQNIRYAHPMQPMEPHHWKFLRTRPANFPTIRIAQLSALLPGFLAVNPLSLNEVRMWMKKAVHQEVSPYWQKHYHFGKSCRGLPVAIGRESIERNVINGLMVSLVRYGQTYRNHTFISGLMDFMAELPPEKHRAVRIWESLGINADSALETQGLLELLNEYCRQKRCLECRFGHHLLSAAASVTAVES